MAIKYVFSFGGGKADGGKDMTELLGGKGANLAEMSQMGVPVPAGFTISSEACNHFFDNEGNHPRGMREQVLRELKKVEKLMGKRFGDPQQPLLVAVRSGTRKSMPGMMETVLNVGLTTKTIPGIIQKTGNPRFVYDAYRRLIMMYADVVMEKANGIQAADGEGIRERLEKKMEQLKRARKVSQDTDLDAADLEKLVGEFKKEVKKVLGKPFPDDPYEQLWGGINAVFNSWNGKRAVSYRRIEGIPDHWGTAVNVQAMVFGNRGDDSATGVAFTRNPATGENMFYGEWLINAQGEDVVAGTRTPNPINKAGRVTGQGHLPSLEEKMPGLYRQLYAIQQKLERHFRDMQDIEFTIEEGTLWMLQTRTGKRTGTAAVRMAVEMARGRLINRHEALMRIQPEQLDELLHPMIDSKAEASVKPLGRGLPAGPGGGTGRIVLSADRAEQWAAKGEKVVLVRNETSAEDVHGMHVTQAILTAKGGMTSHAALVARGWGKCCIVGCGDLVVDVKRKRIQIAGTPLKEGDWITLNGTTGMVYPGSLPLLPADPERNPYYRRLMGWADKTRVLGIRTNADTAGDANQARSFGAEGIGLCRTEHMFFDHKRILAMREMILAEHADERQRALAKLLPLQRKDFEGLLKAMEGLPVIIRLLDPPLHEFVNLNLAQSRELSKELGIPLGTIKARVEALRESNPMLGHRGCRLGITYPEISRMQATAIFQATVNLLKKGIKVKPEVMIPLVGTDKELQNQRAIVDQVAEEVMKKSGKRFSYQVGTMIEVPRAALTANQIAEHAEFFSFGTNDLTQTTYGFSRDDSGSFLPDYLSQKVISRDPFASLDQTGVGQLIDIAVHKGRAVNPKLTVGICGEHGGDPSSIDFCHRVGLDYVSCSPFRVPGARLAAAQAEIRNPRG